MDRNHRSGRNRNHRLGPRPASTQRRQPKARRDLRPARRGGEATVVPPRGAPSFLVTRLHRAPGSAERRHRAAEVERLGELGAGLPVLPLLLPAPLLLRSRVLPIAAKLFAGFRAPSQAQTPERWPHHVLRPTPGWRLAAMLAHDPERLHAEVERVADRRPRIRPDAPLPRPVVVELLPAVVHVLRPSLQLVVRLPLGVLALGAEFLELGELLLLGQAPVPERDDVFVRIPVQLLEGVRPRAPPCLHVVVKDAVRAVVVLRPLRGQRSVEGLLGDPDEIAVGDGVDAQVARVCDQLRLRRL
mmetsp:Transcript_32339/g.92111  ORF Transcript_32339/g.92111 Transcript_32339/m.92111 type:complete len:301 (-) Transcript_32339:169-1071(-)